MSVELGYAPHAGQMEIHRARDYRFRTVCTGRRFGKTLCLAAELLDRGGTEKAGDYGWIAPTYNVAERGIEAFRTIAEGFVSVVGRMPTRVEFRGAAGPVRVWFLSADNPDNIRGYGFQGVVVDEAAMIPGDVWHYVLRPTIAQTLGWAMFVSTPKGRNWFFDMFTRGQDGDEGHVSLRFPSKASPYFPIAEWEDARRSLPADVFRQEYEAEFLADSAGVFHGVDDCLIADCRLPNADSGKVEAESRAHGAWGGTVVGCDLAKHTDFTVTIAMDTATGRCVEMERYQHLEWPLQKERIVNFCRKYRARLVLDATGIGDPIYDDLSKMYGDVVAVKLSAPTKVAVIQGLIVAIEQRDVSWPRGRSGMGHGAESMGLGREGVSTEGNEGNEGDSGKAWGADWEVLTNEMKRYEYEIGPTGNVSYSAPAGYHDDCVMALALANYGRKQLGNCGRMFRLGERSGGRLGYGFRRRLPREVFA